MLLWLKFPFFLFRLSLLLLALILRFLGFKIGQKPLTIANFLLLIIVVGLFYYNATTPYVEIKTNPFGELPELNFEAIEKDSTSTQSLTTNQAQQELTKIEQSLEQQLRNSPTLIPQKTYLNLAILSYYAEENEKASRYLNQARFTDPNNIYFK